MKINGAEVSLEDCRKVYLSNCREWLEVAEQRNGRLKRKANELANAWQNAALAIAEGEEKAEFFRQYAVRMARAYPRS